MATDTTSYIQENHKADECCENIPPGATAAAGTSKFKVQLGDVEGYSSIQPSGDNEPCSDIYTFSTPAPTSSKGGGKAKSRLSGLQSALTPILKYLNIGNKSPSPEPLKHGNNRNRTNTTANSGRSLGDTNAPVCWLDDECLPEITLLDDTCDSTMQLTKNDSALPDSMSTARVTAGSVKSTFTTPQHDQLSASTNLKITAQIACPQNKTLDAENDAKDLASLVSKNTTQTSLVMSQSSSAVKAGGSCDVTFDRHSFQKSSGSPSKQNGIISVSETSLSESRQNTMDKLSPPKACNMKQNHSQVHFPELSKHNRTASEDPYAKMVDIPESIDAPLRWLDDRFFPEITLLDVTRDSEVSPGREMSSMNVTQDILPVDSVQNNMLSSELSGQIVAEPGTLDMIQSGDLSSTLDGNVTHTISSLSEQSDKCVGENTKASLEVTQDFSMGNMSEDSRHSLESSGQNMAKIQTSAEDTNGTHPANVTHDKCVDENILKASLEVTQDISMGNVSEDSRHSLESSEQNHSKIQTSAEDTNGTHPANVTHDKCVDVNILKASLEVTQDISMGNVSEDSRHSLESSEQNHSKIQTSAEDTNGTHPANVTHDKCVDENILKASLEVTRDISIGSASEDSRHSLESSEQNHPKIQTSAEDTRVTHPANVTHDISSSRDISVQCAASQFSSSDMQCNTSLKNVTSELHGEPVVTCNTVKADNEELLKSRDAELTSKVPEPSTKTTGSPNDTFTIVEQSNLSATTNVNTTAQIPQNKTLDLPPSNVNSPKAESDTKGQLTPVSNNTTKTSPIISQNCSAVKASGSCDVQNVTFDRHSLQKSRGSSVLAEAGAATFCLPNNTFDTKSPKQNGTITVSETSSSDSHQSTSDKPSPPKICNATSSPKDNNSQVHPLELSKHNGTTASTQPVAKMVDTPESTFGANPTVELPGAGRPETKDRSQSGLPMRDGISDTLGHQSMDTEDNKANTLDLDDTLDLRPDYLVTSTPMISCKMFNFNIEREEGKTMGAQKKLYRDGPSKPAGPVPSDVPSNIICDRKTFLTQPAAKSFLPPLKAASQLLKYKPAITLPGRFEPPGLPMTRHRTQAEALRNTAASDAPQLTTGVSNSYNLRATTTGSKQPNSGLRKPQLSGIPSGIQRAAPGLRPPSARSNAPVPASTDKLRGPTATNPAMKIFQAKKHPLTRSEALPIAKRKKMDAPLPSGSAEASTSSCDAANGAKNLKQPTTSQRALPAKTQRDVPASIAETSTSCNVVSRARALKQPVTSHRAPLPKPHGCAKCVLLEQQLEMKSEEIRRLKEELLKYTKQEEDC